VGGCGLDSSGSGQGPMAGSCEHDSEPSGCMKGRKFPDQISDDQFLKKDSAQELVYLLSLF
jgi:hypothetical protein